MRLASFTLPATAALLTLTAASAPALAGEGDEAVVVESTEAGPVEITVETNEDGETTKTVEIKDDDGDTPVVKVTETEENGETKKVVEIVDGDEAVVIVESDDDDDEDEDEYVEEIIEEHHHHHRDITWMGLQASAVFSPVGASGVVSSSDGRLRANQFKACADPAGKTACGFVKGMDLKLQWFETGGTWQYPRFVGYFRTGFEQGRVRFDPGEAGFSAGQARGLDYTSVPLFLGGNVYLFDEFPVRPYGGLGFGLDVLRLNYQRSQEANLVDASARIGFELHAGLEVRISNYISLNAEVMQLWSARRKFENLPDYSNTGMSVLAGVTVGIPVRLDRRNHREHHTVRKVRRVRRD